MIFCSLPPSSPSLVCSQQQMATLSNQLVESNRAKETALKASSGLGMMEKVAEKVAEKDNLLEQRNREIDQLNVCTHSSSTPLSA